MIDPLWKKMERAAAEKAMRANVRKKVNARYKRPPASKASYRERMASDAAAHVVPEDTRSLIGRVCGDPLPGRSALDMERAGR
jgi:hypothetical protein